MHAYILGNITSSDDCQSGLSYNLHFALFFVGQLMHGVGACAIYSLGYTYLDENVSLHHSAYYTGTLNINAKT